MTSTQDPSIQDLLAQLYAYTRYVEEQVHELSNKMDEGFQAEQAQNHKHIRYLEEQVPELNKQITNIQGQEVDFDAIPLCSAEGCGAQAAFACACGDPVCAAHAAPCARCGRGPFCGECRTEVGHTCAPSRPPPDACGTAGAEANSAQLDVLNTTQMDVLNNSWTCCTKA